MAVQLKAGDKAPDFTSVDQDGNTVKLKDLRGSIVALYFYPQDLTPTCTDQACNLRDNHMLLMKQGIKIIGVSPDGIKDHQKFIAKHNLPFTLLADTDRKIIESYGLWAEKQMFGKKYMGVLRTTFLIDEKGLIIDVIHRPKSKDHAAEILELLPVREISRKGTK